MLALVSKGDAGLEAAMVADTAHARQLIESAGGNVTIQTLAAELNTPVLSVETAVPLLPTHIAKPWGQEIWYTGMEVRGVSHVGDELHSVPLPWLLSLMPEAFCNGKPEQLTLLKILDPLPDEVYGDLYFEMHERKQEVYVVTHVNKQAWPDGRGGIRFGFNQRVRAKYASDDEFKAAYLETVKRYESVRRRIDECLDGIRLQQGVGLNDPVEPARIDAWLAQVPDLLVVQEAELRAQMDSFSNLMPLQVGDVVRVPCMTPHSLLHGVRTVEFQTPVYERKILSFAQKVLTQQWWDTEEALQGANLDVEAAQLSAAVEVVPGLTQQEIVDFDDFRVWRLRARASVELSLAGAQSYQLLMAVSGKVRVAQQDLACEQAALLPANGASGCCLFMESGAVALLAAPIKG
ncbi:hypothetical protein [Gilvimarinus sp. DA14]|uniref:hypothetical protein n=1 Tax=Gilvimarinus sp. DA14 TaxID=2956798 RepID=UPI0020B81DE8|nr:hypothetical protein [Gilvimarinus sp. DA14]UTF60567.1 hypothetical protein NHM04_01870 [Gilvimarinus sp. DA14]